MEGNDLLVHCVEWMVHGVEWEVCAFGQRRRENPLGAQRCFVKC